MTFGAGGCSLVGQFPLSGGAATCTAAGGTYYPGGQWFDPQLLDAFNCSQTGVCSDGVSTDASTCVARGVCVGSQACNGTCTQPVARIDVSNDLLTFCYYRRVRALVSAQTSTTFPPAVHA
jgi:hypothetical protein